MRIGFGSVLALGLAWQAVSVTPGLAREPVAIPGIGLTAAASPSAGSGSATAADSARATSPHGSPAKASPHASPHGGMQAPSPHTSPHGGAPPPASGGVAGRRFKVVVPPGAPKIRTVTLGVRHRVYHDFIETSVVKLREPFAIGDTPYSATILDFIPDFMLDLDAGRITSRSTEPRNPAFRIVVRESGVPADTTWAFLNMPPHFAPKSLLAFKVMRIDFADRPALPDTSAAARKPAPGDTSAAGTKRASDAAGAAKVKP